MAPETKLPLLLSVAQVERLVGYRRSKIYALMQEKDHAFPAQVSPSGAAPPASLWASHPD